MTSDLRCSPITLQSAMAIDEPAKRLRSGNSLALPAQTDATNRTIAILTAAREDAIPPRAPRVQLMKIAKITATPVNVPLNITFVGASRPAAMSGCLVEIETDAGLVGTGSPPSPTKA